MNRLGYFAIGLGAGLICSAALAFQETQGGAVGSEGAPAAAVTPAKKPPLNLKDTGTSIGSAPEGIEIRVPGLGKLGTVPKFDFGLELLYGANDATPGEGERWRTDQLDDVQIRGSLKHKF